ncbi:MAG: phosphoglycerate dehydrogenase [Planctomycetes bacterium]|nr:phosphoglycerate dehydrogenase [Planctomycetota bacterium]
MPDKFRILAADKLADEGLDFLRSQPDVELVNKAGIKEDELARIIGEHDGMIVRSGVTVTAKVLENPGRLKIIARAGVGVDNIDLEAATSKGILVVNSAEASTITTAEHAFALLMALARNIGPAYKVMAEGGWDRNKFNGRQLAGKTLGVVGFGRIGRTVAERALAFGMNVVAYDPFINAATMMDGKVRMFSQFIDLVPHADILTFHVPLNEQTRGLLNKESFCKCRKGVLVVNASRGGVVDESAVIPAIDAGQCGGAALDVFETEPPAANNPLRKHPKVLLTPHLGASTVEAQQAVSVDAAASVLAYLRGEGIHGAVNAGGIRLDLDPLQQRYVDLAQRMARLISPMITRGIGRVTFEISGDSIAAAAGTLERMALVGLLQGHMDVPLNVVNVRHVAEQRGIKLQTIKSTDPSGPAPTGPQLTIEVHGPEGAVASDTPAADRTRRIVGRVYQDMRPRVVEINGYFMDMVPAGAMALIQNEDRPGIIGVVGSEFGAAGVNIADMAISRRETPDGKITALMVLKVDGDVPDSLLNRLRARPGILKVATVKLPKE